MSKEVLENTRNYYNSLHPLIMKSVGSTYQAGTLIDVPEGEDPYRATNLFLADRAGIQPGMKILDAGCGACGPAIDIASHIPDVRIEAVTLSSAQAAEGKQLIEDAGLADKIRVQVGDYHELPFDDETFDLVYFFESSGYAYDLNVLFSEAFRVLNPGGVIYVKDVFAKESLSAIERAALEEFDQVFAQKTRLLRAGVSALAQVGFVDVQSKESDDIFTPELFLQAMEVFKDSVSLILSDHENNGQLAHQIKDHQKKTDIFPIFFGEVWAKKEG